MFIILSPAPGAFRLMNGQWGRGQDRKAILTTVLEGAQQISPPANCLACGIKLSPGKKKKKSTEVKNSPRPATAKSRTPWRAVWLRLGGSRLARLL